MGSLKSEQEHWQQGGTFPDPQMEQAGQAALGRGAELSEPSTASATIQRQPRSRSGKAAQSIFVFYPPGF